MRKDLNMRKGKMIAQGAHASITVLLDRISGFIAHGECRLTGVTDAMGQWIDSGQTKICVSVDSEQELLDVVEKARAHGLVTALIQDAGHTEFGGVPTYTCCAIGPDVSERVDEITGKLKLL